MRRPTKSNDGLDRDISVGWGAWVHTHSIQRTRLGCESRSFIQEFNYLLVYLQAGELGKTRSLVPAEEGRRLQGGRRSHWGSRLRPCLRVFNLRTLKIDIYRLGALQESWPSRTSFHLLTTSLAFLRPPILHFRRWYLSLPTIFSLYFCRLIIVCGFR